MSDSVNWGIWLPVIGAVSGFAAVCSIGIVLYFYCSVRDSLSPVGSGGGAAHVRDQHEQNQPTSAPESSNRTSSRVRFQDEDNSTDFPRNRSQIVRIEDGQHSTGKYSLVNDEEVSYGTSRGIKRNDSRNRLDDTSSSGRNIARVDNGPVTSHGDDTGYDEHIIEHIDGSQDVFV